MFDNHQMNVPEPLEAAFLLALAPASAATENAITVDDVWEYLVDDEWEIALGLLEGLGKRGDGRPLPVAFWETLAEAAEQLRLERSAAWCRWRCHEVRHGVIRADLALRPASEGRRKTPLPGAGVLRPMWDIGHRSPTGELVLSAARLWIEERPFLEPGGRARIRLTPLDPSLWQHLEPGLRMTLHEDRTVAGTATVLEIQPPAPTTPSG
jgi:hypothetical protein